MAVVDLRSTIIILNWSECGEPFFGFVVDFSCSGFLTCIAYIIIAAKCAV